MPLSRARDYLSIGEVLEEVKRDFPDVSISKIRFLEAEGLIAPERTSSGYRKFFEGDVRRLRYILSLQRDQFLPLRVIRERLAAADANGGEYPASDGGHAPAEASTQGLVGSNGAASAVAPTGTHLSRRELLAAAGLTELQLVGLEEFGVIERRDDAYDEDDLVAAHAAKAFLARGIDARHLRMFRQFADREVALYRQVLAPMTARREAAEAQEITASTVAELAHQARRLHEALLRSTLRDL